MPDLRALLERIALQFANSASLDHESRQQARRESRLLAAAVLDVAPGTLTRRLDMPLAASEVEHIQRAADRRTRGEPLAYAVGTAAFRHLVLQVDHRVLIPRPETEIVVETVLAVTAARRGGLAVDIGTGSGAIALALASEGHFDEVWGTDVSSDALSVAESNRQCLAATASPVTFACGADFAPMPMRRARVIVSNPPYIAFDEAAALPASVRDWEPSVALFAGEQGMARYDVLLAGAPGHLEANGWVVLEVDSRRSDATARLAIAYGYVDVRLVKDLSNRDRVLVARHTTA